MSTELPARPQRTSPLVHLVHSGLTAPYELRIHDLTYDYTVPGAFTSALNHPTMGIVGTIFNDGRGSATTFHPHDDAGFGEDDLAGFAGQCAHDDLPTARDSRVESVLNHLLLEADIDDIVLRMRNEGTTLVRPDVTPRSPGDVIEIDGVPTYNERRTRVLAELRRRFPTGGHGMADVHRRRLGAVKVEQRRPQSPRPYW